ncbi:MAG: hypothetical protein ACREBS_05020 [Nitrososphaerales archaeon]
MDFIKKRLLTYAIAIFALVNFEFISLKVSSMMYPEVFSANTRIPAAAGYTIDRWLCLSRPVYIQYGCYLKNVFATWPPYFGPSYGYFPASASSVALQTIPSTLLLIIPALLAAIGIIYALGIFNAMKRGSKSGHYSISSAGHYG